MKQTEELLNNVLLKGRITFIETFPSEEITVAKIEVDEKTCLSVVFQDNMYEFLTESFKKSDTIMLKAFMMGEVKENQLSQWLVCKTIYPKSIYAQHTNTSQFVIRGDILSIAIRDDNWIRIIIKTCAEHPPCTAIFPIYLYAPNFDIEDIDVNDRLCFSGSIIGGHTILNNSNGTYDFFMEVEEIFN